MARRLSTGDSDFAAKFGMLVGAKRELQQDLSATVQKIVSDVRARKDAAVIEHSKRLDRTTLTPKTIRLSGEEVAAAEASCKPNALAALDLAAKRIESFHRRQIPQDAFFNDEIGVELGWRWTALDSVGLYVPGGTAAYPSSVLMNAVPAKVAGVSRIAMTTPAVDGRINPLVLAAAKRAGVTEIYRVGGAQAISALAYGTETITPVDKIVGPGSDYVAEAKRQVFGQVGIDSVAGPSEVLVVADAASDPEWIAADLLAQAEHDPSSQSILITDDEKFARAVEEAVSRRLATLPRRKIAEASWQNFGAVIVANSQEIPALVDRLAPEHLELSIADPKALLGKVRHAGAIFLGRHTPEAVGDYIAGPNHVLPTSRAARFSSGLSVLDFMKRTTLVSCSPGSLPAIGADAIILAEAEGLDAHALSVAARLNRKP